MNTMYVSPFARVRLCCILLCLQQIALSGILHGQTPHGRMDAVRGQAAPMLVDRSGGKQRGALSLNCWH